jgi:HEAT repeat protein
MATTRRPIDAETLRRIRETLRSDDPALRAEGADAVAVLGDLEGLLEAARHHDPYLRIRAVRSLAQTGGLRATARIACVAFGQPREVREEAAAAFAARRGVVGYAVLLRLAADEESMVRYRALSGLAATGGILARRVLERAAARDRERWLRVTAAMLLKRPNHRLPSADSEGESDAR